MAKKDEKETRNSGKDVQVQTARPLTLNPFDEVEHLFEDFLNRGGWLQPFLRRGLGDMESALGRTPRVDVIERDDEVVVKAELPGVSKDNLDVSIDENVLSIRASVHSEKKEEKGQYVRREMRRGEFQRNVRLPGQVAGDKATASFKDGVLEVTVPKTATSTRKSIKID